MKKYHFGAVMLGFYVFFGCRSARKPAKEPIRSTYNAQTIPESEPATVENSLKVQRNTDQLKLRRDQCDQITEDLHEGKKEKSIEIGIQRPIDDEIAEGYVGYRCYP